VAAHILMKRLLAIQPLMADCNVIMPFILSVYSLLASIVLQLVWIITAALFVTRKRLLVRYILMVDCSLMSLHRVFKYSDLTCLALFADLHHL
jgi:hypothetical protein